MQADIADHRHASVREVAIHISNHSMQNGDRGVVVVGASAELGDLGHLGSAGTVTFPAQHGFLMHSCCPVVLASTATQRLAKELQCW